MPIRLTPLISIVFCILGSPQLLCAEPPLLDVLRSRAEGIKTFQADVSVVRSDGKDRVAFARALQARGEWFQKESPDRFDAAAVKSGVEIAAATHASIKYKFRQFWKTPFLERIEEFGSMKLGEERGFPEPVISLFNGEQWQWFSPKKTAETRLNQMMVLEQPEHTGWFLEVARGGAFFTSFIFKYQKIPAAYQMLDHVHWHELFPLIVANGASQWMEPLPGGGKPKPVLQLLVTRVKPTSKPLIQVKIWFEPMNAYLPIRMEQRQLFDDVHYDAPIVVEWSDPIALQNGMQFARRCVMRFYFGLPIPTEGVPEDDWPISSFEEQVHEITYSNVNINMPLKDDLFSMAPPPSTAVADFVSGQQIVIGKAGEELERTAMEAIEEFPIRDGGWFSRHTWALALVGITAGCLVIIIRARRVRARRSRR